MSRTNYRLLFVGFLLRDSRQIRVFNYLDMKVCTKCLIKKEIKEFYLNKWSKGWCRWDCKKCVNCQNTKNRRTKKWLISNIFRQQKTSSIKRIHNPPEYTKEELFDWVFSQDIFDILYNNWIKSWFNYRYTPSIDRKNDYIWYKFNNIQLMTWGQNCRKAHDDVKNWLNNKRSKAVSRYNREWKIIQTYYSIRRAWADTKINNSHIVQCCKWKRKTAWWFKWKYKN